VVELGSQRSGVRQRVIADDHAGCFDESAFIVAPGLTVKGRLQVLIPTEGSYYDQFNLCPSEAFRQKLNQAEVLIENWHTLMPAAQPKRSVVKKGAESDEAFTRRVLGKLAKHRDIIVINDEAHHAYRKPAELKISKKAAADQGIDLDEATRWIEGLDRLHKTRRIQRCFDLSATPFAPTGKASTDTALFDWIISDFGLNDAIENRTAEVLAALGIGQGVQGLPRNDHRHHGGLACACRHFVAEPFPRAAIAGNHDALLELGGTLDPPDQCLDRFELTEVEGIFARRLVMPMLKQAPRHDGTRAAAWPSRISAAAPITAP
jgi:hypothetical protein